MREKSISIKSLGFLRYCGDDDDDDVDVENVETGRKARRFSVRMSERFSKIPPKEFDSRSLVNLANRMSPKLVDRGCYIISVGHYHTQ